jgi:hypothetical protein
MVRLGDFRRRDPLTTLKAILISLDLAWFGLISMGFLLKGAEGALMMLLGAGIFWMFAFTFAFCLVFFGERMAGTIKLSLVLAFVFCCVFLFTWASRHMGLLVIGPPDIYTVLIR